MLAAADVVDVESCKTASKVAMVVAVFAETRKEPSFRPWSISTPPATLPAKVVMEVMVAVAPAALSTLTTFLILTVVPVVKAGRLVSVRVEGAAIPQATELPRLDTK